MTTNSIPETDDKPSRKTKRYMPKTGKAGGHVRPHTGPVFVCAGKMNHKGTEVIKVGCGRLTIHSGTCMYGCGAVEAIG